MDEIRPFSEDISYGQIDLMGVSEGIGKQVVGALDNFPSDLTTDEAVRILQHIRDNDSRIRFRRGLWSRISKPMFEAAQKRIRWRMDAKWNLRHTSEPLFDEMKKLKKLQKIEYPVGKISSSAAKPIAETVAKEVAKKKGIVLSGKLLAKWTGKILPWVGWGIVATDLIRRGMKELESDNKSESNIIPHGEFYHKDKGWY